MKGADQCPACGSRKWAAVSNADGRFYARTIRVCANCRAAWEPFDEADLLDAGARYSSFTTPCDNCAFRKGSPEQRDPDGWADMMARLGWTASFYCHKGVPIDPKLPDGFAYPQRRSASASAMSGQEVTIPDVKRLRLCRGYLNWLRGRPCPGAKEHIEHQAEEGGAV